MLVSAILTRVGDLLQDADHVRWPEAELLRWINDGQREIVRLAPSAGATRAIVQLAAGLVQSLPAGGISLFQLLRNMGINGATPGPMIRLADWEDLTAVDQGWGSATAAATVANYTYNPKTPKLFLVSPPQPTANQGYVELIYAALPAEIAGEDSLGLDDRYVAALLDYVLFRAFDKDAEQVGSLQRANAHYTNMLNGLGVDRQNRQENDPNHSAPPLSPAMAGRHG